MSAVKSLTCKSANSCAAMLPQLSSDLTDSLSRKEKIDIKYNANSTFLNLLTKRIAKAPPNISPGKSLSLALLVHCSGTPLLDS